MNHKLMRTDWIGVLTGMTSNDKFNQFSDLVDRTLDEVAPIKTVKIATKRQFMEPWMTRGLEIALRNKMKLYRKTLTVDCTEEDIRKYKQQNVFNNLKRQLKRDYYHSRCITFKQNAKKLWNLINNTMEIDNLIKNLLNKTSHGHDNISNIMLKALRTSITFPSHF